MNKDITFRGLDENDIFHYGDKIGTDTIYENGSFYKVRPETITMSLNFKEYDREKAYNQIYVGDIIEVGFGDRIDRFLINFLNEGNSFEAVKLNENAICYSNDIREIPRVFNEIDSWNWEDFTYCILDPYGDNNYVKIIGNIFLNFDLITSCIKEKISFIDNEKTNFKFNIDF